MNSMSASRNPQSRFRILIPALIGLALLINMLGCSTVTAVNPPTFTPTAALSPTTTSTATATPVPTLDPIATELPALCSGPRVMFILLVGSDARSKGYRVGLADSIRLVRVDFTGPGIQILSFPRDLYVEIPGIEKHHGITHGKLNQAYLYGNPGYGYFDGTGQGPGLLALTLNQNFGVQTDHFVAVNLQSFVRMVDALGGIDLTLPEVIDGRVKGSRDTNRYFKVGGQHLNGYRTMLLARLRPQGDFQRV